MGTSGDSPHPQKERGLQVSLIKSAFFGLEAKKSIAKTISFAKTKNRKYAKVYTIPTDTKTGRQLNHRALFLNISEAWKNSYYSALDLKAWSYQAQIIKRSSNGRNMFFSEYLKQSVTSTIPFLYNLDFFGAGPNYQLTITSTVTGMISFRCLRGPLAGLILPIPMVAFVPFVSAPCVDQPCNIFRFLFKPSLFIGASGYFPLVRNWYI